MPRIGAFDFPSRDLDDCLSYLRMARKKLSSRSMTRESLAHAIGQSPRGGGFGKLVGAMAAYGLVETGRGRVVTTETCEQILYGDLENQRRGRERSVRNVRLFDEIVERFGGSPGDQELRIFLRERTKADLATSRKAAAEIGKLLRKSSAHFQSGDGSRRPADEPSSREQPGGLVGRLEMADYGILNIRDGISMDLAIGLLTGVKKSKGWGVPGLSGRPAAHSAPESGHDEPSKQGGKTRRSQPVSPGRRRPKLRTHPR